MFSVGVYPLITVIGFKVGGSVGGAQDTAPSSPDRETRPKEVSGPDYVLQ